MSSPANHTNSPSADLFNATPPPPWMLPNFFRSPLRVLPALTAGTSSKTRAHIPFTLARSRNKMADPVENVGLPLPASDSSSCASGASSEELDTSSSSSSIESKVAQKIEAQEARRPITRRRTPLRERVAQKLRIIAESTPDGTSPFNIQILRATLLVPISAVLGSPASVKPPSPSPVTLSASQYNSVNSNPTTSCSLGQNVYLTRAMPFILPPTVIWTDASWGNWKTVEARWVVHILPGEQAVRAYGERSQRGKLPPSQRHLIPSFESGFEEGPEGLETQVLRLIPQPQRHGGESALSSEQLAEAMAFVSEAWEEAENLQRASSASSPIKVELPPILFVAPSGQETDASLAALALAFVKSLSGGAGRRQSAYELWTEMVDDESVPAEWRDALGLLGWQDVEFVEEMWPEVDEKASEA